MQAWQIPRLPASKKYDDPGALERAINKYFKRCYSKTYNVQKVYTEDGDPVVKTVISRDLEGKVIFKRVERPELIKLSHYLGMRKSTFDNILNGSMGEIHQAVAQMAKEIIEGEYIQSTLSGDGDSQGLRFVLKAAYGYEDETKIKLDGDLKYSDMTDKEMAKKMKDIEDAIIAKRVGEVDAE